VHGVLLVRSQPIRRQECAIAAQPIARGDSAIDGRDLVLLAIETRAGCDLMADPEDRTRRLLHCEGGADVFDAHRTLVREGEERRLLAVASPASQRLIVGALETAMRRGELLQLRWADVDLTRRTITVKAATSKTRASRVIPVSARLAGILEMGRTDPTGRDYEPTDIRRRHRRQDQGHQEGMDDSRPQEPRIHAALAAHRPVSGVPRRAGGYRFDVP
jgi:hypothetical protein